MSSMSVACCYPWSRVKITGRRSVRRRAMHGDKNTSASVLCRSAALRRRVQRSRTRSACTIALAASGPFMRLVDKTLCDRSAGQ